VSLKLIVVDLDGCLCKLNTFRYWLVFISFYFLFSLRWLSLLKIYGVVFERIFRGTGRVVMKRNILLVTGKVNQVAINWFCCFLNRFTNQDVLAAISKMKELNAELVLSTAAPDCYVNTYSKYFNFFHVFSTPSLITPSWKENIGIEKLEFIQKEYGKDVVVECMFTDHHDDLPLLLAAHKQVLVRPNAETIRVLGSKVEFEII